MPVILGVDCHIRERPAILKDAISGSRRALPLIAPGAARKRACHKRVRMKLVLAPGTTMTLCYAPLCSATLRLSTVRRADPTMT